MHPLHEPVQPGLHGYISLGGRVCPTTNSRGAPIAMTYSSLVAFWEWFGNSSAVDSEGRPLVLFHGSTADIVEFEPSRANDKMYSGGTNDTIFFTDNPEVAASYAGRRTSMTGLSETFSAGGSVYPVYLKITKPLKLSARKNGWRDVPYKGEFVSTAELTEVARSSGRDGLVVSRVVDYRDSGVDEKATKRPSTTFVVFNANQVKSAVGNNGYFNPLSSDISDRAAPVMSVDSRNSPSPQIGFAFTLREVASIVQSDHKEGHREISPVEASRKEIERYLQGLAKERSLRKSGRAYEQVQSELVLGEEGVVKDMASRRRGPSR